MDMLKKMSFESYSVLSHDEDKINVGNKKSFGQLFCRWVHSDPPICNLIFQVGPISTWNFIIIKMVESDKTKIIPPSTKEKLFEEQYINHKIC